MTKERLRSMMQCAIFAAILCICAPITISIGGLVPITLGLFAVMLAGVTLGWRKGTVSVLVFLFIGICGLPVFSSGKSGIPALVGPTGGYIWSWPLVALLIGFVADIEVKNEALRTVLSVLGCVVGTALCYACGTLQYMLVTSTKFAAAMKACVIPFIPVDLAKGVCASILGVQLRRCLKYIQK